MEDLISLSNQTLWLQTQRFNLTFSSTEKIFIRVHKFYSVFRFSHRDLRAREITAGNQRETAQREDGLFCLFNSNYPQFLLK